nr:GIY-YIG nuclease family protein [Propionicimonas sp.]
MARDGYVYFMTNERNTTLYIGVTSDLLRRIVEHKLKLIPGFTSQYNCNKLVYYEAGNDIGAAIAREKQLKNWRRAWKNELITGTNPNWDDLSARIGITPALLAHYTRDPGSSPG